MSRVVRPAASALANRAGISTWTPSDTRLRRQRQCELIWRFRPRVIFELIDELDQHHGLGEHLDRRLSGYAALDPQVSASYRRR